MLIASAELHPVSLHILKLEVPWDFLFKSDCSPEVVSEKPENCERIPNKLRLCFMSQFLKAMFKIFQYKS